MGVPIVQLGPGHRSFKPATRVQIPLGTPKRRRRPPRGLIFCTRDDWYHLDYVKLGTDEVLFRWRKRLEELKSPFSDLFDPLGHREWLRFCPSARIPYNGRAVRDWNYGNPSTEEFPSRLTHLSPTFGGGRRIALGARRGDGSARPPGRHWVHQNGLSMERLAICRPVGG